MCSHDSGGCGSTVANFDYGAEYKTYNLNEYIRKGYLKYLHN